MEVVDVVVDEGTHITLPRHGGSWRVGTLLGEGGQGAVYQLDALDQSASLALKWYRPEAAHPDQLRALSQLAELPAPSKNFLWPMEVVEDAEGGFGYVMPLRPPSYLPIADLLTGRADASFSTVAKLCMRLADSFLKLHSQGLCYRDISLGNVFFDPATGVPLVCDNDNVGIDGREPARVLGTSRFMAPEVVRGEAQPSTATDLYSLSVLLFYLLMFHHPLQGKRELGFPCFDRDAEREMFGTDPLFVFDPTDDTNAPDPAIHASVIEYWRLYPNYLRDDFVRAFTVGLTNPTRRVREGVWRSHLARLLDSVVVCACGRENLTDDGAPMRPCWACRREIPTPVGVAFGQRVLVLNAGTRITRHQLLRNYAYDEAVAEVVPHPTVPNLWGLRNTSDRAWRATTPDGAEQEVAPGRSIGLVLETRIDFGPSVGVLTGRLPARG